MRIAVAALCVLFVPMSARAQSVEAFGGYSWAHPDFQDVHLLSSDLNGWRAGVVVPVRDGLGVVADVDGVYGTTFNTGIVVRPTGTSRPWLYSVEAGPQYTFNADGRLSPFVDGLVGVIHGQVGTRGIDFLGTSTDTRLEGGLDGGATMHLTHAVGVRGAIGYRWNHLFDQRLAQVRITGAIVWELGGK